MASLSSSSTTVPPSWLSDTNNITLRDASFSSYLNTTEHDYIRSLVTTPVQDDGELDVFSADKYFKGDIIDHTKPEKYLSKLHLQPRTPSIHSESSWNSQRALVRPVQRNSSRRSFSNRVKKIKKSSFFSSFYCCDAKSIDIKVYEDEYQTSNYGDVSFNNEYERGTVSRTIKTSFDTSDIARFNSSYDSDMFSFPVSEAPAGTYSDTESDTSSDLFEISVDWSVVTASAADFSVTDDFEEHTSTLSSVSRGRAVSKPSSLVGTRMNKGRQKTGIGGMLSGCKSQKAVEVVEAGNRKFTDSESRKVHRFSDCYSPVTRLQTHGNSFRHSKSFSSSGLLYI